MNLFLSDSTDSYCGDNLDISVTKCLSINANETMWDMYVTKCLSKNANETMWTCVTKCLSINANETMWTYL